MGRDDSPQRYGGHGEKIKKRGVSVVNEYGFKWLTFGSAFFLFLVVTMVCEKNEWLIFSRQFLSLFWRDLHDFQDG